MNGLLSKQFLAGIGVNLDSQAYASLSELYESTLNDRVISEIVDELNELQLSELQTLRGDDPGILQSWLIKNVPQLTEIIEDEIAILLGELAEDADKIA